MTDKVQKIRAFLVGIADADGVSTILARAIEKKILPYIDSLQEEPIGKVWHYQKEEPIDEITDKSRPIVVIYGYNSLNAASKFRCYEDNSEAIWLSNNYEKWAFIEDLIDLSQSVKTSDQEEPAPNIFEDMLNAKTPAESLGISQEEHDRIVDELIYGKEPELVDVDDLPKEELVSEELEKAAIEICSKVLKGETITIDGYEYVVLSDAEECFKAGAKWQKEYMMKEIKIRLVDAATNQDKSTDVVEQTYYNGMVDALGRLRDKFMED